MPIYEEVLLEFPSQTNSIELIFPKTMKVDYSKM